MITNEFTFIGTDVEEDDFKLKYHSKYCIIINDILMNQIVSKNKILTPYAHGIFYHFNDDKKFGITKNFFFTNINWH